MELVFVFVFESFTIGCHLPVAPLASLDMRVHWPRSATNCCAKATLISIIIHQLCAAPEPPVCSFVCLYLHSGILRDPVACGALIWAQI